MYIYYMQYQSTQVCICLGRYTVTVYDSKQGRHDDVGTSDTELGILCRYLGTYSTGPGQLVENFGLTKHARLTARPATTKGGWWS